MKHPQQNTKTSDCLANQKDVVRTGDAANSKIATDDFLYPWKDYAINDRWVFLDEILNFVGSAGNSKMELKALRGAVKERKRILSQTRKRGGPRGANRPAVGSSEILVGSLQSQGDSMEEADEHREFRDICMVCGDYGQLRHVFLKQILYFVQGADKKELAMIRIAVADRAKSRGLRKKRGRPSVSEVAQMLGVHEDDELMHAARVVAWSRRIERKSWSKIAQIVSERFPDRYRNLKKNENYIWTLRRIENYLAARIWRAVHSYWVDRAGSYGEKDTLKPGILDLPGVRQCIRSKTGLPFKSHPDQCKRIVKALFPRGSSVATEETVRRVSYFRNKKSR